MTTKVGELAEPVNDVLAALSSDAEFRRWYERTLPRVFSYLASRIGDTVLAEELTQETYIAAIDDRWRFDGRSDSVTWLCGIARHKLADHYRRLEREERRARRVEVREIDMPRQDGWAAVEERDAIAAALRGLPAAQQAVLMFVGLDGLSAAEAGRLLGRSAKATQSLYFRAREGFRAAYGREVPHA